MWARKWAESSRLRKWAGMPNVPPKTIIRNATPAINLTAMPDKCFEPNPRQPENLWENAPKQAVKPRKIRVRLVKSEPAPLSDSNATTESAGI